MINFLRFRTATAMSSVLIFTLFAGLAYYKYATEGHIFEYSIDFTGGTQVLFRSEKPISADLVSDVLSAQGWQGVEIRTLDENEVIVRVQDFLNDVEGLDEKIIEAVQNAVPENTITLLQSESVGPGVGKTLRSNSIKAVLLALIAMLIYIALRFWSFAFAAGAVAALFHDATIMLAIFFFFDRAISINTIGAILTILGYSINDTIVIFSQIKENLKTMDSSKHSLNTIVNKSLNMTLRRTILTSVSTALPLLVLLLFGGKGLFDFSLALLAGVIFGTYSSVYIASPVMMLLYKREANSANIS